MNRGDTRLADLLVGDYDLRVSKAGFSNMVRTGVTLTVGAQSVVDFSLQVGQQAETITVEAQASQVDTANSTVGTLTDEKQMSELPLNGRNFEQLIQLSAGVNTLQGNSFIASGFQGRAPEYSISGSRPEGQAILLDDENLQNFWNKGMGSVVGTSLGVEAIGEFQTLTNTYSAQFGGNGGVINAVSKTGSNSFHGSLYEFFRNSDLDARQFIDPATIPALRQNQFGGTLGGPIKKDKMFFFFNYEGIRLVQGETRIAQVPGCNLNPANCVPTTTNPVAAQAIVNTLQAWPNATTVVNGQPEALSVANENAHENYFLGRFDYNISSTDSILARYISDKAFYLEPYGGGGFGGGPVPFWPEQDYSHTQFGTIEWRRILSPTMVNVARCQLFTPGHQRVHGQDGAGRDCGRRYGSPPVFRAFGGPARRHRERGRISRHRRRPPASVQHHSEPLHRRRRSELDAWSPHHPHGRFRIQAAEQYLHALLRWIDVGVHRSIGWSFPAAGGHSGCAPVRSTGVLPQPRLQGHRGDALCPG